MKKEEEDSSIERWLRGVIVRLKGVVWRV